MHMVELSGRAMQNRSKVIILHGTMLLGYTIKSMVSVKR